MMPSAQQETTNVSTLPSKPASITMGGRCASWPQVRTSSGAAFSADTLPRMVRRRSSVMPPPPTRPATGSPVAAGSRKRLRVRFAIDEAGAPTKQVFMYPAVPADLFSETYWSKDEFKMIGKKQKKIARNYQKPANAKVVDAIYCLHGYTNRKDHKSSSMTPTDAQYILSRADCRGLEAIIAPLIGDRRRWAVDQIMSIQARCQGSDDNSRDQCELLMSVWSLKVGVTASLYAQQLAQVDSMVLAAPRRGSRHHHHHHRDGGRTGSITQTTTLGDSVKKNQAARAA